MQPLARRKKAKRSKLGPAAAGGAHLLRGQRRAVRHRGAAATCRPCAGLHRLCCRHLCRALYVTTAIKILRCGTAQAAGFKLAAAQVLRRDPSCPQDIFVHSAASTASLLLALCLSSCRHASLCVDR